MTALANFLVSTALLLLVTVIFLFWIKRAPPE